MHAVKQKVIEEVAARLKACGATYRIRLEDGTEIGDLVVEPPKRKPIVERTTYSKIYKEKIRGMGVGDVVVFKLAEHPGIAHAGLSSAVSAGMCHMFGSGSSKIYWNARLNQVEVMRLK